jgi:hypothetical protein
LQQLATARIVVNDESKAGWIGHVAVARR